MFAPTLLIDPANGKVSLDKFADVLFAKHVEFDDGDTNDVSWVLERATEQRIQIEREAIEAEVDRYNWAAHSKVTSYSVYTRILARY